MSNVHFDFVLIIRTSVYQLSHGRLVCFQFCKFILLRIIIYLSQLLELWGIYNRARRPRSIERILGHGTLFGLGCSAPPFARRTWARFVVSICYPYGWGSSWTQWLWSWLLDLEFAVFEREFFFDEILHDHDTDSADDWQIDHAPGPKCSKQYQTIEILNRRHPNIPVPYFLTQFANFPNRIDQPKFIISFCEVVRHICAYINWVVRVLHSRRWPWKGCNQYGRFIAAFVFYLFVACSVYVFVGLGSWRTDNGAI
jgi:hypothetical protein